VRSLVGTVLLKILSLQHDNSLEADKGDDVTTLHGKQLVDRFTQIVERSDGRVRRVDEFARQLNVTPKYLSRLLKDTIDRNPSDIIELFTMKAIERRLRFTDMTMQQIANDLNFANPSFFGKYFKDHAGMTPMAFRMKYQKT
jgi:AraC-like DNA-binding protein